VKYLDWGPYKKNMLVECFSKHAGVTPFRISATTLEDAETQVAEILEKHHANFLRRSQGKYQTRFTREPKHDIIKRSGANRLDVAE
jgi:hypothetical protein